jgi:hypothetical protein
MSGWTTPPCIRHAPAFNESCPDCLFEALVRERTARAEAERRLAVGERVIAGTAYPSDATLTREQAFHGWEVANRQRDGYAERALAAERALSASREEAGRYREALAGVLAVADGDHCACGDSGCTKTREAWAAARAALSVDDGAERFGEGQG